MCSRLGDSYLPPASLQRPLRQLAIVRLPVGSCYHPNQTGFHVEVMQAIHRWYARLGDVRELTKGVVVLALSARRDNPVMWAHYAGPAAPDLGTPRTCSGRASPSWVRHYTCLGRASLGRSPPSSFHLPLHRLRAVNPAPRQAPRRRFRLPSPRRVGKRSLRAGKRPLRWPRPMFSRRSPRCGGASALLRRVRGAGAAVASLPASIAGLPASLAHPRHAMSRRGASPA
jgi:hypothetical protein